MIITKFISFIVGFTIFMLLSAPKTGYPNRIDKILGFKTSLIFKLPSISLKIHIHHWLYLLIIRYFIKIQKLYGFVMVVLYMELVCIMIFIK